MKNLFTLLFILIISSNLFGQEISRTVTKELDTIVINKVPKNKVVSVTVEDDTTISILKKYASTVPPTGATVTFSFIQTPLSSPDIISPGRGAEQWHNGSARIPNPTETQPIGV